MPTTKTTQAITVSSDVPNVYRAGIAVPIGQSVYTVINIDLLREQLLAALGSRMLNANPHSETVSGGTEYSIDVGFQSPPSAGERSTVDGVIAAHNPAVLTQAQQDALTSASDESSFRDGVVQAVADGQAALVTIGDTSTPGSDLALLVNDRAAVNAATLAAPLKAALLDVIDIQTRTLNRQKRIIQILLTAVKALRWLVTS